MKDDGVAYRNDTSFQSLHLKIKIKIKISQIKGMCNSHDGGIYVLNQYRLGIEISSNLYCCYSSPL
jgi:hypothetical protein